MGADDFVNRNEELVTVREIIQTDGKFSIIGSGQFGKTSLFKAASERFSKVGNIIFSDKAESFAVIDGLMRKIIEDSTRAL